MKNKGDFQRTVLGIVTGCVAFVLLFVMFVYPEIPTASYSLAALLLVLLLAMAWMNQRALKEAIKTRTVRYGANAAMTVGLVLAILCVGSYLNFNHFVRKDLTKNKSHSLSDQTVKILKDLQQDVKLTVYVKTGERDAIRPTIDSYLYQSKKVSVEYVDPDREPVRTKAAGIKKYGTVVVQSGKRESRVDELNEEKLTNAFLKVLKDNSIQVCFLSGHGEKSMSAQDAEGYSRIVQTLQGQNYESKQVNLLEDAKIPVTCTVVLVLGPTKSYFEKEVAALRDWLDAGGRALFALDPNLKGDAPLSKEMNELVGEWYVDLPHNLVIDPASRVANVSASVPLIAIYSKEQPITRDFTQTSLFPLTSTVEQKANPPGTLHNWWLAKSTPYAFAKKNFVQELATGKVSRNPNTDTQGPNVVMMAVEGPRPGNAKKSERPTRLIVVGTSQLGANKWAGFGGNEDLFVNSVSWLAGDENLISIRPKDEGQQRASLSEIELSYTKFLTKLLIPGSTLLAGLIVWRRRKRL